LAKATTVVNGLPQSVPSAGGRHPHLYGMLVALAGLLLVALPAAVSAFSAAVLFTGCSSDGIGRSAEHGLFACHAARPVEGTLLALVALVLLALPVIAGVLTDRQFSRRPGSARALKIFALVVLLGMAVPCVFYSAIMILGTF